MNHTKRLYIPGSEWVYYKLYTGPKTADTILTDLIDPVINNLSCKNLIEKWFFIRYFTGETKKRGLSYYENETMVEEFFYGKIINI